MRHDSAQRLSARALAGLLGLLLFATSCDGPNRFGATPVEPDDDTDVSEPPVLEIRTPATAPVRRFPVGDSILVEVRAADDEGLQSLSFEAFAVRGDPLLGTREIVPRFENKAIDFLADDSLAVVLDTIVSRYLLPNADIADESVFVVAKTTDLDGFIAADTVRIETFIPEVIPPSITIELPRGDSLSAIPLGDSVFVRARVSDDVGIRSVTFSGVAFRGDPDLGTDEVVERFRPKTITLAPGTTGPQTVFVTDTTLMRYLNAVASDSTRETAYIIADVVDVEGLTASDTVPLVLGGPNVQLLNIDEAQSIQAGLNLNLGVRARDPQGVTRVRISLTGAIDTVFTRDVLPARDSIQFDTILAIPPDLTGSLTVSASARNSLDVTGADGPFEITILPVDAGDTIRPTANMTVRELPRYELTDSLVVTLTGRDDNQGSGIVTAGVTAQAVNGETGDTITRIFQQTFAPLTGTVSRRIPFRTFNANPLTLPDTVQYSLTGYLIDAEGNCSATNAATGASAECRFVGDTVYAQGRTGLAVTAPHVAGRTVLLPGGVSVGDAVLDTARQNLLLSSRTGVQVFRLGTQSFGPRISAGFEPWGLSLSRDGDSLWVANSSSTTFSVIDLDTEQQVEDSRFFTPDVTLFDIQVEETDAGVRFLTFFYPQAGGDAFTDEPQYVAVDRFGNLVYSTVVNSTGTLGTARKAFFPAGADASEVKLFTEHGGTVQSEDFWAVANVDGVSVSNRTETETDSLGNETEVLISELTIFDHVPGFPDQTIQGSADLAAGELPGVAASRLRAAGSDVTIYEAARWDIGSLGFGDTTYVAASGDGNFVAVGEGARDAAARVLMYRAAQLDTTNLSGVIPVNDFLTNTSERVRGVAVNYDGTLALARGDQLYFFDENLRKLGGEIITGAAQSSGAAFHPLHANARGQSNLSGSYNPNTHLALYGSGDQTLRILDTFQGEVIGELKIRDNIVGPLRVALPFGTDNVGLTCASVMVNDRNGNYIGDAVRLYTGGYGTPIAPNGITDDACVVLNVYGVTSAGGVVVIPVRKADVLRLHPNR